MITIIIDCSFQSSQCLGHIVLSCAASNYVNLPLNPLAEGFCSVNSPGKPKKKHIKSETKFRLYNTVKNWFSQKVNDVFSFV